jgi:hypothetical protein
MSATSLFLLALLAQAAPDVTSHEDKDKAQELLSKGSALYESGDYVGALEKFSEAYAVYPSPKLWFNIGQVSRDLDRPVEAMEAFEKFLALAPDASPETTADARSSIVELKRRLGQLRVDCPANRAEISVDGRVVGYAPLTAALWVTAGRHQVTARDASKSPATEDIEIAAGSVQTLVLRPGSVIAAPQPLLADEGFEMGMRLGWGLPSGRFSNIDENTIPSQIAGTVPLVLEASYHLTREVLLGATFQHAWVTFTSAGCDYVGADCGGTQTQLGLEGRYRRSFRDRFDVWGSVGFGYEWLSTHGGLGSVEHRGLEALRLGVGADVAVVRRVSIGPFVSYSFARFDWGKNTLGDSTSSGGPLNDSGQDDRRWHRWLVLGIRGTVAVVR